MRKIKIINKVRFSVMISILVFLLVLLSICITNTVLSYETPQYKTIYISKGDTLWGIAKKEQQYNLYYVGKDIRYILEDLKNMNHINNSYLYEGQSIMIPTT